MKQRNLKRMIATLLAGIMVAANINATPVMAGETSVGEQVLFEDDFEATTDYAYLTSVGEWTAESQSGGAKNSRLNFSTLDESKVLVLSGNNTYTGSPRLMKAIDVTGLENLTVEFDVKLMSDDRQLQVGVNTDMSTRSVTLNPVFWKGGSSEEWTTYKLVFEIDGNAVTSKAYKQSGDEWTAEVAYGNVSYNLTDNKIYLNFYACDITNTTLVYVDNVKMFTLHEIENENEQIFTADFEQTTKAEDLLTEGWDYYAQGNAQYATNLPVVEGESKVLKLSSSNVSCSARIMKTINLNSYKNVTVQFDVKNNGRWLEVGIDNDDHATQRHIELEQLFWEGDKNETGWVTAKIEFVTGDACFLATAYTLQNEEWVQDATYSNVTVSATDGTIDLYFLSTYISSTQATYLDNIDIYTTHSYIEGVCTGCGKAQATLMGHSLTLDGTIGVNFCVKMPAAASCYENMKMKFELPSGTQTVTYNDATTDANGYKVFTCNVPAKEMTDTFTATLYDGDAQLSSSTYSVKEYADVILADTTTYAEEIPLVQAMLNYGSCAQSYFNYNTDKLANGGSHMGSTLLADVSSETLASYQTQTALGDDNVKLYGASLVLESKTTLRLYFAGEAAATAICNGEALTKKGNYYYVDIDNIIPQNLDEDYTVTLAYDNTTVDVTYNCMTFGYNVLKSESTSDAWKNLVRALYLYSEAATTYLAE